MINRCLVALFCFFSASSAFAQLMQVGLDFDQETYLPREALYAIVCITNTSGRTLVLGRDNDWLSFTVENVDGSLVKIRKPADVKGEFTLPSSSRAKKLVNLAEAFDLAKFGRYEVRATVRIPEWGENFDSKPVPVGIATGAKLWEANFGLPGSDKGAPEARKFELLSANHLKRLSLYVRVTGLSEEDTFNLFPLGILHGFSRPEPQMDRWSNLHVFYQDGARSFTYNMITPDGLLLARERWEISADGSRPGLKVDEDGHISVSGGVRRISPNDLPPPDFLTDNSDAAPESKAADKPLDVKTPAK